MWYVYGLFLGCVAVWGPTKDEVAADLIAEKNDGVVVFIKEPEMFARLLNEMMDTYSKAVR